MLCDAHAPFEKLSQREIEVLILIARGPNRAEIGASPRLSTRTVRVRTQHIVQKSDLPNTQTSSIIRCDGHSGSSD